MNNVLSMSHASDSRHAISVARLSATRHLPQVKQQLMLQIIALRRSMQKPVMTVVGVLVAGGAAKTGYGGWVAGLILTSVSLSFSVTATAMLTRSLGAWVARMQRYEGLISTVPDTCDAAER